MRRGVPAPGFGGPVLERRSISEQVANRILAMIKGSENELLMNEVVLRTQAQAEYVAENYGHFGLNLRRYAHFTSPSARIFSSEGSSWQR